MVLPRIMTPCKESTRPWPCQKATTEDDLGMRISLLGKTKDANGVIIDSFSDILECDASGGDGVHQQGNDFLNA